MEAFLNWLFGKYDQLRTLLEGIWNAVYEWGHWYAARGIYILLNWYGQYVAIISSWYERIKNLVYDYWTTTFMILVTLVDNVLSLANVWFSRIMYVVNDVWLGFQKLFSEWWSMLYLLFTELFDHVVDLAYSLYLNLYHLAVTHFVNLLSLALDLYDSIYSLAVTFFARIIILAQNWYLHITYLIEKIARFHLFFDVWWERLTWIFSADVWELLFAFLQNPLTVIWLYITEFFEEKLEELLDTYW